MLTTLARRWNPSGVYDDPRVRLHHDDARAFLERASPVYDRIVYGRLDSQALSSSMTNLRLDGFVYTVEGFRAAWKALTPDGAPSVAFFVGASEWLAWKLHQHGLGGRTRFVGHSAQDFSRGTPAGRKDHAAGRERRPRC